MRTYTADEVDAMIGRALARERERVAQQQKPVGKKTRIGLVTSAGWDSLPVGTEFYTTPQAQPAQQEPVAVPTTSYEHRKFVLVGRDWYERFAAFHDDCQIGEQLTWQEKTIRQQGYENGWNDAQRYLKEPQSTSPTPAQQEPVAWMYPDDYERMTTSETFCTVYSVEVGSATRGESTVALYTSPPTLSLAQRTWDGKAIEDLVKEELRYYRDGHYIEFSDAECQLRSFAHRLAAQRTWVHATEWRGLTDEEMYGYCPNWLSQEQCKVWIEQIEAKLKAKNSL